MSQTTKPTETITKTTASFVDPFEVTKKMASKVEMSLVSPSSTHETEDEGPGKGLVHYIKTPKDLRDDHPVWHYFYLCTLIFAAFVALFIGPVIFGMLAAIGGIGTPVILSVLGCGIGLLSGLAFGVIFAVVCIVALVRGVGLAADQVWATLLFGGRDLLESIRQQVLILISDDPQVNN